MVVCSSTGLVLMTQKVPTCPIFHGNTHDTVLFSYNMLLQHRRANLLLCMYRPIWDVLKCPILLLGGERTGQAGMGKWSHHIVHPDGRQSSACIDL